MLVVRGDVDAEIADHAFGHRAVGRRALDGVRAAVAEHEGLVDLEFITLGMAAEVVVVF